MSGVSNADPLHPLTVDAPPPPILKDMQGPDNSFPLSPQWLLPKLGDNKLVQATGESQTDPLKSLANIEDHNVVEKRKDVFRPSFYDTDKVRRNSWADEERDANSAIRRDLLKEGEEFGDSRKVERWSNNTSRYSNESRHFQSERWSGSGSRESAYEPRRESKWNTRWGPDDKESENWREKPGNQTANAKDIKSQGKDTDKEGEHSSRSWRSSMAANRGRGEAGPYLPSTTNKPASMFGYGRGKGDIGASVYSADRSRVGSSTNSVSGGPARQFPLGTAADRLIDSHRDPPGLRYNRIKLFDIYRMTDLKGYRKAFEEFQDFPSLIQADHLVPLAFTAPIAEEMVIMEAIEKGEILSSGVPQALKDGSSGKISVESGLLPLNKSGIGEDVAPVVSGYRDEKTNHGKKDCAPYVDGAVHDKSSQVFDSKVPLSECLGQYQEAKITAEAFKFEDAPNSTLDSNNKVSKLENTIPWRSHSVGGRSLSSSNDLRDLAEDGSGSRSSDIGWLNTREEMGIELRSRSADFSSYIGGDAQRQDPLNLRSGLRTDSRIRMQPSSTIEQGHADPSILRDKLADRNPQQYPSPEQLSLFYKDPQGQIQGPFSGSNLIEWFDAGYFGIDLLVRLASAPADTPFLMLGDVIPQLRTRVRPPPGFGSSRPNDIVEGSNRGKVGGAVGVHVGISDLELKKYGQVLGNESKVEAENRFLESLMAGRISSALSESFLLSEGLQEYNGLAAGRSSLEIENMTDMLHMPQKMSLEQQKLLTPFRPGGGDPSSIKVDNFREVPIPPKFLPQVGEISHQQHLDLLSILQSATNKTNPPPINSSFPLWPNFSDIQAASSTHESIDIMKDAMRLHPNQKISQPRFGTPPNMLHTQFQPSLSNQTPFFGFPSGVLPSEMSVPPEYSQDAHMANLLRQQYILNQNMHSQVPHPTQLNQMELLLLLQRQKLEQQQQQYQQQEHLLLSRDFSGHQLYNNYEDKLFRTLKAEADNTNVAVKSPFLQMHQVTQSNHPLNVLDSNNSHVVGLSDLNLNGAQDTRIADGTERSALNFPDQVIDLTTCSNEKDAPPLLIVEPVQISVSEQLVSISNDLVVSQGLPQTNENVTVASNVIKDIFSLEKDKLGHDLDLTGLEMIDHVKVSVPAVSKQACGEMPGAKVKDLELCEVKKSSEKKSRKHKNFQLLKVAPGLKAKPSFETGGEEKYISMEAAETFHRTELKPLTESLDSQGYHLSSEVALDKETKVDDAKVQEVESVPSSSSNQAWKFSPGQKVKPFLEIQVEEQNRAQKQSFSVGTMHKNILANVSTPSEQKYDVDTVYRDNVPHSVSENPEKLENPCRNRSQLHDVLAEDVLPKVSQGNSEEKGTYLPSIPDQNDVAVDHDFIEAKETRKARKKAAKSKGVTIKSSSTGNAAGLSISVNIVEQTKACHQPQQDKELLPSPLSAPSLGDFVFWKGEQASTVPPPVWSTDSVKVQKPALLKDIFKEQDKSTKSGRPQVTTQSLTKVQPNKGNGGGSSLVQVSSSPPSKGQLASPLQTSSLSLGQQKPGVEDDLFWGPLNQTKQSSRSDFPSLANPSTDKLKGGIPVKVAYGEGSNKKASSSKPAERSITTSSAAVKEPVSKGKKDSETKNSDAADFRDWCEVEWLRLTGTNDTSFLEFCLKQTTAEAEVLLRENLSLLDRGKEFVDKFVNYKKFLSSEIIELAFGGPSSRTITRKMDGAAEEGVDGQNRGKKKGKKGKKLSPALLGFNVVSNRIMMGEIQAIED